MKIVKIGDCFLNLENVTHVDFENSATSVMCTLYFNCQITDRNGCNGIQASKTFTAEAARELRAWLEVRTSSME